MPLNTPLKIAYISSYDPLNKQVWSGTPYSIYRSLKEHGCEIDVLGPCAPSAQLMLGRIKNKILGLILKKRYNYSQSFSLANAYAAFFDKKLKQKKYDVIIAPSASCVIARLKTEVPIVYITDSTVKISLNYHANLSRLTAASEKESLRIEQEALTNASLSVFSSQWAAQSAKDYFKVPEDKIMVLPFGANFELLPKKEDIEFEKIPEVWNLLFVGVYWESKGGEFAYNCLMQLLKLGIKAKLVVCGCVPPEKFKHELVEVIPYLNKNNNADAEKLSQLFKAANFLILPTRFDCTPIVICEASAYGLPTLCADTGGVKGHLREGVNGFLVDYNDRGILYAQKIQNMISSSASYVALRKSSRELYDKELNWKNWSVELLKKVEEKFKR